MQDGDVPQIVKGYTFLKYQSVWAIKYVPFVPKCFDLADL